MDPGDEMRTGLRGVVAAVAALGALTACGGRVNSTEPPSGAGPQVTATLGGKAECPGVRAPGDSAAHQLRGMWIATVENTDWPSRPGEPVERQKAEYRRLLDTARALHLNAVFFQVRPAGDAFYRSPYEPWSQWLTGTQGKDPGYDVLRFLIQEAHKRDLELHAWFNPYRASMQSDRSKLAPGNPARQHPGWAPKYGSALWYDPGLPQVQDLVTKVVLDVVHRYDIDGVHFDDYFYPYPDSGDFSDKATFKAYGNGFSSVAAWRRHNVDTLVQNLSGRIHQAKSWVKFGISPFGVWRNVDSDRSGSRTQALQSYDDIYADSRLWVKKGWLDYVTPQLYWPIGDPRADYQALVGWWARQVTGTGVQLSIGQAAYRVGEDATWRKPAELSRHLMVNARFPAVRGDVYFSARDIMSNRLGFVTRLRKDHYQRPAIVPVIPKLGGAAPPSPTGVQATVGGTSAVVRWQGAGATSYAVYRVAGRGAACAPVDPKNLLVTVRATEVTDTTVKPGATYTYYVTALDRLHHESPPARGVTVVAQRG
jgi:uncharacterized lipoprotein YddW (UPF0748 family)